MPRKPGRPRFPTRRVKRGRPAPRTRFREEPAVTQARLSAAQEALQILARPPEALDAMQVARGIHELTDRSITQVHAACQDGHHVACQSGCTYCCQFPVAASAPEVLAIAAFVRERFDAERRAALHDRVDANIAATAGMAMDQRDRVRLDCPFLEAGKCAVYEVRPVACRGYSSYRVEACRDDYQYPGAGIEIPTNNLREFVAGAIREGLGIACRSASVEYRLLELVRAYQLAARDLTLVENWRSRPEAFCTAVGASVFPGPWSDEIDHDFEEVFWATIDRLEGNAGHS